MSDSSKEITIKLTPRAAAYLQALVVAHEARIADQREAREEDKAERLRAVAESRHADPMICSPHRPRIPELTFDQIAERALERGAAYMLGFALQPNPGDDLGCPVPLYQGPYPLYPRPIY